MDTKLKHRGSIDTLVYPFIYESSFLCDYEVLTDELCARLCGLIDEVTDSRFKQLLAELQEEVYHANGSIRGKLALLPEHVEQRIADYSALKQLISPKLDGFTLPRGAAPVAELNLAKSNCKKIIRILVRVQEEGVDVPQHIADYFNVLGNIFFTLSVLIIQARGETLVPFISKSYPTRSQTHD